MNIVANCQQQPFHVYFADRECLEIARLRTSNSNLAFPHFMDIHELISSLICPSVTLHFLPSPKHFMQYYSIWFSGGTFDSLHFDIHFILFYSSILRDVRSSFMIMENLEKYARKLFNYIYETMLSLTHSNKISCSISLYGLVVPNVRHIKFTNPNDSWVLCEGLLQGSRLNIFSN